MIPTTADIGQLQVRGVTVHRCEDDPPRARDPMAEKQPQQRKPRKARATCRGGRWPRSAPGMSPTRAST